MVNVALRMTEQDIGSVTQWRKATIQIKPGKRSLHILQPRHLFRVARRRFMVQTVGVSI
jgi:hypothetical protein